MSYGLLARYAGPDELVRAARGVRAAGYLRVEAYTSFRVEELAEVLGHDASAVRWAVLACGGLGAAGAYAMQYWSAVVDYPVNVGGRPLHSWPSFVPVTFELTVLAAAMAAVFGMLLLNGLPRPHHPVLDVPEFVEHASTGFFLAVRADDPAYDADRVRALLASLGAEEVVDVA